MDPLEMGPVSDFVEAPLFFNPCLGFFRGPHPRQSIPIQSYDSKPVIGIQSHQKAQTLPKCTQMIARNYK